jgi:Transposase and inactivated derivatives
MPIKKGENRSQFRMLCSEDLVASDDMVRVIDAFVEALEMESFGFDNKGKSTLGREAFSNKLMLKIYLFGYSNKIRSTRNLAKACQYDIRLWWLTEELKPKYRVIADFRLNNLSSFKKVFRSFTIFLKRNELISGEVIAVDGTKIKASNSRRNNYSAKKLDKEIKYIDKQIEQYLIDIQAADESHDEENGAKMKSRLAQVQKRKNEKLSLQAKLENSGANQISTVDADARLMKSKHTEMAYNTQASTCDKNNLLADFTVTNKTDMYALHDACKSVKELLDVQRMKVLADKGYYTGLELKKCKESKIETYVSPRARSSKKDPAYRTEKFIYNKKKDRYICPEGNELKTDGIWRTRTTNKPGHKSYQFKNYKANSDACSSCPFREKCLPPSALKGKYGKKIERSEYQDYKDANDKRVAENKDFYRRRQQIVEHPFGTIKRAWGMSYTMLRTIPKVEADMAMAFLAYNMLRAKNIMGAKDLIEKLKEHTIRFIFYLKRTYQQFKGILEHLFQNKKTGRITRLILKPNKMLLCEFSASNFSKF